MTTTIYVVLVLVLSQVFADFIMQIMTQLGIKEFDWKSLIKHSINYFIGLNGITAIFFVVIPFFFNNLKIMDVHDLLYFCLFNACCHFIIKAISTKIDYKFFKNNEFGKLLTSIAITQMVCYALLLMSFTMICCGCKD